MKTNIKFLEMLGECEKLQVELLLSENKVSEIQQQIDDLKNALRSVEENRNALKSKIDLVTKSSVDFGLTQDTVIDVVTKRLQVLESLTVAETMEAPLIEATDDNEVSIEEKDAYISKQESSETKDEYEVETSESEEEVTPIHSEELNISNDNKQQPIEINIPSFI